VVGLGISGIATALRLHRAGWEVVVLEKAAERLGIDLPDRFSTVPVALRQDNAGVEADIRDRVANTVTTERFDLVVGAAGLRSTVRRLMFGPDEGRIHRLGYMLAACSLPGYGFEDGLS
jgi:2-polyprenyl-6-methoxyphenol hydroxylase-like FAD-dependent oxidoreductase